MTEEFSINTSALSLVDVYWPDVDAAMAMIKNFCAFKMFWKLNYVGMSGKCQVSETI